MSSGLPTENNGIETTPTLRGWLVVWGIVLILIGGGSLLLGLSAVFNWLMAVQGQLLQGASPRRPTVQASIAWREVISGSSVFLIFGAGVLWTGIASCLARRWTRPVVMVIAAGWAALGLLGLVSLLLCIPHLVDLAATAVQNRNPNAVMPDNLLIALGIRGMLALVFGIALPWAMFRFYASDRVRAMLDSLNPGSTWIDRVGPVSLGWIVLIGVQLVSIALTLMKPMIPAFVTLITGSAAVITIAILLCFLGYALLLFIRGERAGWVVSFIIIVALKLSLTSFYATGGSPIELAAIARPEMTQIMKADAKLSPQWLPAVMTGLETLIVASFGVFVGKRFTRSYRIAVM